MSHWCIVGSGSAIGQVLVGNLASLGEKVTAVAGTERRVLATVQPCDVLVTLTGLVDNAKIDSMTDCQWDSVLAATLHAPFNAVRQIRINNGGRIVVVGSIVGSTGGYGCANYAAAKAGLVGLVRAAANENPHLCINLLELGYTEVGMGARLSEKVKARILPTIPLKRFARIEEVLDAIDYLGRVTYATGSVLTLAGGLR